MIRHYGLLILRKMKKLFTHHPYSVGETYWQHFWQALSISFKMGIACIAQLIHAVFPFIFPPLGTDLWSLLNFLTKKLPPRRSNADEDTY